MYEKIIFEKNPPRATIKLNSPEVQNALSVKMLNEIKDALSKVENDEEVIVLVIDSVGEHFCSGIDIRDVGELSAIEGRKIAKLLRKTFAQIRYLEKPVIAKIRGNCLGAGLEIALSCDFLIGSEDSAYGFPHMKIGIPSIVEAGIIPYAVGIFRAKELFFIPKFWDAKRAYNEGILYRVCQKEDIDSAVDELADTLSQQSPLAMSLQKEISNKWITSDLENAIDFSVNTVCISFASEDQKEGMRAFLQKRKPKFKGK